VQAVAGLAVMGIAGFAWLALAAWLPSGAERFYLLVPPTFLGLVLTWPLFSWKRVAGAGRTLALSLGVTFLLAYSLAAYASGTIILRPELWHELLCGLYFLLALGIVLVSIRWVVRGACKRLAAKTGNRWHGLLTEVLPLVVLTALYAPYLLGVAYVHRFKVAPQSNPLAIFQRSYEDVEFRTEDDLTLRGLVFSAVAGGKNHGEQSEAGQASERGCARRSKVTALGVFPAGSSGNAKMGRS